MVGRHREGLSARPGGGSETGRVSVRCRWGRWWGVGNGEERDPCRRVLRVQCPARANVSQAGEAMGIARLLRVVTKSTGNVSEDSGLEVGNDNSVWDGGSDDSRPGAELGAVEHSKARK